MTKRLYSKKGMSDADRFWMRVRPEVEGCWGWTGRRMSLFKYAGFTVRGPDGKYIAVYAHRYSYELHFGPIPDGMLVRHTCDNPVCVRPDHLLLGRDLENQCDSYSRGRRKGTIITNEQVREIRERLSAGESRAAEARRIGCSYGAIRSIDVRRTRKGV
jgi:hypothetical protein